MIMDRLKRTKIRPSAGVQDRLRSLGSAPIKNVTTLEQLLRRNEIFYEHLRLFAPDLPEVEEQVAEEAETRVKYDGYIKRQERHVEKMRYMESVRIPQSIDYYKVHGLSTEVRQKLDKIRPVSLGQASRISGVTPAAIMALQVYMKKMESMAA